MAQEADNLDRAADLTRALAEAQIAAVRRQVKPEQVQNPDGTWPIVACIECDADLGQRLALGKIRCVTCQDLRERGGVRQWPR
ncbi:hypothetical protein H4CHR_02893 [Variovorax sp. PBS-H4]|uniref:hypothetical protein n=1 Tax=Variovorax sp. PBS-H4 TaxID=434008 RepID=UPI001317D27C|nr:hypothetical protein [Variovorax sp. PBS-H4]VTU31858.1 hypothetical protein H4CHR_02893 [Variovorax sp. PBS-H4]